MFDKAFTLIQEYWNLFYDIPTLRIFFSFGLIVVALLLALFAVWWRFSRATQSQLCDAYSNQPDNNDNDLRYPQQNFSISDAYWQRQLQDEWETQQNHDLPTLSEADDLKEELTQKIEFPKPSYQKKDVYVPFDWNKDISQNQIMQSADIDESMLSYHAESKSVKELAFLIIDMICRGLNDAKIVQTLNFRTQGKECPFDILQIVTAVRRFMDFCIEGKFFAMKQFDPSLPNADEALFLLAKGDSSLALFLLQAHLQFLLDKARTNDSKLKEKIRINILKDILTFASLAEIDNLDMAIEALNLIVDLAPDNPLVLSRIADINLKKGNIHQAASIYSQILEAAQSYPISSEIVANAQFKLAQYFGHSKPESNIWKRESWAFFTQAELCQKLSPQEIKIINLIETKGDKDIENLILQFFTQAKTRAFNPRS